MTLIRTQYNRRSFLKVSAAAGGGMMIGFSWLTRCTPVSTSETSLDIPKEWYDLNGYIKIGDTGLVTIFNPNPEIGQNVMTSMPMVVADELEVKWEHVIVEQGSLDEDAFKNPQFAGGSLSLKLGWDALRMAGAAGKYMLLEAAAKEWEVDSSQLVVADGIIKEKDGERTIGYGDIASKAVDIQVPDELDLKEPKDYRIIGTHKKNVRGREIVTGQPQFGLDFEREGMKIAMIHHPPAFGLKVTAFNEAEIKSMAGVNDAFIFDTSFKDEPWSAVNAFNSLIAVIGDSTWQLMKAKKAIKAEYEKISEFENTRMHEAQLLSDLDNGNVVDQREDGDVEQAFAKAVKIVERSYSAPFMAHNTLEPMNFFADVKEDSAELIGPTQTPKALEEAAATMLGISKEKISVDMTRMGGGFGRRLYTHFGLEAAAISKKAGLPIKLIYSREDDMTQGTYRPPYLSTYKAGLDENNTLIALSIKGVGLPEGPVFPNRFPAGAVENYAAQRIDSKTNISTGAWRAPRSHFTAGAEQSFLDEVAEAAGKDAIEFRLELFDRAINNPVGDENDYDPKRYAGVLELVKEKSGWGSENEGVYRGVAAYFCHYSYVAQVMDIVLENGKPVVEKVWCAVDCGIVVNKEGAKNIIQGGVIDGIGHAMYSQLTFEEGRPQQQNFDKYDLIRNTQAPKEIEVFFVECDVAPTGLGEPGLPPAIGALANALYQATGKRQYHAPFTVKEQGVQVDVG